MTFGWLIVVRLFRKKKHFIDLCNMKYRIMIFQIMFIVLNAEKYYELSNDINKRQR